MPIDGPQGNIDPSSANLGPIPAINSRRHKSAFLLSLFLAALFSIRDAHEHYQEACRGLPEHAVGSVEGHL
jgi:hypothetical protein